MATIQLSPEILSIESAIDDRRREHALQCLTDIRGRSGHRPEFRYLQALYDATFSERPDQDLIREVTGLVAEQPDFTEPVALLALLFSRAGDHTKAEVFAREALRAVNPRASQRAHQVLQATREASQRAVRTSSRPPLVNRPSQPPLQNRAPSSPPTAPSHPPFNRGSNPPPRAPSVVPPVETRPLRTPQARLVLPTDSSSRTASSVPSDASSSRSEAQDERAVFVPPPYAVPMQELGTGRRTRALIPSDARAKSDDDASRIWSHPPSRSDATDPAVPQPVAVAAPPVDEPLGSADSDPLLNLRRQMLEPPADLCAPTTPSPADAVSSAPLESASVLDAVTSASPRQPLGARRTPIMSTLPRDASRSDSPGCYSVACTESRVPTRRKNWLTPEPVPSPLCPAVQPSLPQDVDRRRTTRKSSPELSGAESKGVIHDWFEEAKSSRVVGIKRSGSQPPVASTALMLLGLAERVVDGDTPLSDKPVSLDRMGLRLVESHLEALRRSASGSVPDRATTTAAGALLLAMLIKECDARAVDTTPEDGACKAMLPSGSSVRPLFVAAALARGKGPGLVETLDRAASGELRGHRTSSVPPPPASHVAEIESDASSFGCFVLSVARRDLDAGAIGVIDPRMAASFQEPSIDLRAAAQAFWSSPQGIEVRAGHPDGGLDSDDGIAALELFASRTYDAAGLCPPGSRWPWVPDVEQEKTIAAWGAVLGEVLNSKFGGRWEVDAGSPDEPQLHRVVLSGSVVAWPMAQVYLRLARGVTHDLFAYLQAVGRVVQARRA